MSVVRAGSGSAPGLVRCPGKGDPSTVAGGGWSAAPIWLLFDGRTRAMIGTAIRLPAGERGDGPDQRPRRDGSAVVASSNGRDNSPPTTLLNQAGVRPLYGRQTNGTSGERQSGGPSKKRLVKGRGCPPRRPLQVDRSEAGTSPLRSTSCLPRPRLTCHDKGA